MTDDREKTLEAISVRRHIQAFIDDMIANDPDTITRMERQGFDATGTTCFLACFEFARKQNQRRLDRLKRELEAGTEEPPCD